MFAALMRWMKAQKLLPVISETEREALEAGDVWLEGQFFSGSFDAQALLQAPYLRLTEDEQAFLDGPVERLLKMIDREEIAHTKRVPRAVLAYLKSEGFMGLALPREYGGKGFSALALSAVMGKIGTYCNTVGTYVVIPNSLGAGELILHYGSEAQKQHYLPRLARGEYLPAFALTEATAGSDAASLRAEARVQRAAEGGLELCLNFRKRYITLAPVANLFTIAAKVVDPERLLGGERELGITTILVHADTTGFQHGEHHDPVGDPFDNGPICADDVIVPLRNVIGGRANIGRGWRMLMEQLAGGRAISLPAGAVGAVRLSVAVAGAYSMVRQQFGLPIGRMEGVQEKVGRIAALGYALDAARILGCSALNSGIKPPVASAILKAYTTEIGQTVVKDAMDVCAGAGVMQGPNNLLARNFCATPVGVTVEGANILTRTLMIFGQGATRCHPYALAVVDAVEADDVPKFRSALMGWMWQFASTLLRTVGHGLTRGYFVAIPKGVAGEVRTWYRRLGWATARYGFLTNLAMFAIGGSLKRRGKLTGRYADALAWMFIASASLRRFEAEGQKPEDLPLVHAALAICLAEVQHAFEGIYANFDGILGLLMRPVALPWLRLNPLSAPVSDAQTAAAAECIQTHNSQYHRLTEGLFKPRDGSVGLGRLLKAFRLQAEVADLHELLKAAQRRGDLPKGEPETHLQEAARQGLLSREQSQAVSEALQARLDAIEVDAVPSERYYRDPLPTVSEAGKLATLARYRS